jgi:hypothetical protein
MKSPPSTGVLVVREVLAAGGLLAAVASALEAFGASLPVWLLVLGLVALVWALGAEGATS